MEGEATVSVAESTLELAEAVERMLSGRLRWQEFVGGDHAAAARVEGAKEQCYSCGRNFVIWDVASLLVLGRCGLATTYSPGPQPVL